MKNIFINNQKIIKSTFLFLFAAVFLLTILNDSVFNYVHKRHIPMIIFAIIIFIISGITEVVFSHNLNSKNNFSLIIIFLIPIILYFFSAEELNLSSVPQNIDLTAQKEHNPIDPFANNSQIKPQLINDTVIMDDNSFGLWLPEIYINTDLYINKPIEITGELWYGQYMPKTEFAIGRLMMTCCAADMQAVGLGCKVKKTTELKDGEWVKIKGLIKEENGEMGSMEPYIEVLSIEKYKRPVNPYAYPF